MTKIWPQLSAQAYLALLDQCQNKSAPDQADTPFFYRQPSGWRAYTDTMHDFWRLIQELGYIAEPFDYLTWLKEWLKEAPPGANAMTYRQWIDTADKATISKFLLYLNRHERFFDGLWITAICNGLLSHVLRRIIALEEMR